MYGHSSSFSVNVHHFNLLNGRDTDRENRFAWDDTFFSSIGRVKFVWVFVCFSVSLFNLIPFSIQMVVHSASKPKAFLFLGEHTLVRPNQLNLIIEERAREADWDTS